MVFKHVRFLAGLAALAVLSFASTAFATGGIHIEWIRGDHVYGSQTITATGASVQSSAAPDFGGQGLSGTARISVTQGAVIVAHGDSPVATQTNGERIDVLSEPYLVTVNAGQQIAIIEATDPARSLGSLSGSVGIQAATTGGTNTTSIKVANNTTSIAVCTAACTFTGLYVQNNSANLAYLKTYDAPQGSVTCGSGTPKDRIMIPANAAGAGAVIPIGGLFGAAYGTALTVCITGAYADTDTTAPAANAFLVSAYTK